MPFASPCLVCLNTPLLPSLSHSYPLSLCPRAPLQRGHSYVRVAATACTPHVACGARPSPTCLRVLSPPLSLLSFLFVCTHASATRTCTCPRCGRRVHTACVLWCPPFFSPACLLACPIPSPVSPLFLSLCVLCMQAPLQRGRPRVRGAASACTPPLELCDAPFSSLPVCLRALSPFSSLPVCLRALSPPLSLLSLYAVHARASATRTFPWPRCGSRMHAACVLWCPLSSMFVCSRVHLPVSLLPLSLCARAPLTTRKFACPRCGNRIYTCVFCALSLCVRPSPPPCYSCARPSPLTHLSHALLLSASTPLPFALSPSGLSPAPTPHHTNTGKQDSLCRFLNHEAHLHLHCLHSCPLCYVRYGPCAAGLPDDHLQQVLGLRQVWVAELEADHGLQSSQWRIYHGKSRKGRGGNACFFFLPLFPPSPPPF